MHIFLFQLFLFSAAQATTYEPAQTILVRNCAECHGGFVQVPGFRFLKNTSFFFDLPNGGKRQKMPKRMTGIRITEEEALVLRDWLLAAAPDMEGNATLSPEQVDVLFK